MLVKINGALRMCSELREMHVCPQLFLRQFFVIIASHDIVNIIFQQMLAYMYIQVSSNLVSTIGIY